MPGEGYTPERATPALWAGLEEFPILMICEEVDDDLEGWRQEAGKLGLMATTTLGLRLA